MKLVILSGCLIIIFIIYKVIKSRFGSIPGTNFENDPAASSLNSSQKIAFNAYLNADNSILAFLDQTGSIQDTNIPPILTITFSQATSATVDSSNNPIGPLKPSPTNPTPAQMARTNGIIMCLGQYTSLYAQITRVLSGVPITPSNTLPSVVPVTLDATTKHAIWTILLNKESQIINYLSPNIIGTL